jgi:hypothetical protein
MIAVFNAYLSSGNLRRLQALGYLNSCRAQYAKQTTAYNMTDLIDLVMGAAATELLHAQTLQIDQDIQRLLEEMERAPVEECRRGDFAERFLVLLERRGKIARKALVIFEEPALPRTPAPVPHS